MKILQAMKHVICQEIQKKIHQEIFNTKGSITGAQEKNNY